MWVVIRPIFHTSRPHTERPPLGSKLMRYISERVCDCAVYQMQWQWLLEAKGSLHLVYCRTLTRSEIVFFCMYQFHHNNSREHNSNASSKFHFVEVEVPAQNGLPSATTIQTPLSCWRITIADDNATMYSYGTHFKQEEWGAVELCLEQWETPSSHFYLKDFGLAPRRRDSI